MNNPDLVSAFITCATALFINLLLFTDSSVTFLRSALEVKKVRSLIIAGIIQTVIYALDYYYRLFNYINVRAYGMFFSSLVYICNAIFLLNFAMLIYDKSNKELFGKRINKTAFLLPIFFILTLSILNMFTPIFFDISKDKLVYSETIWIMIPNLTVILYIVIAGINDFKEWKKNSIYNVLPISIYFIPSLLGTLLETIFPLIPIVPLFCALSIMLLYFRVLKQIGYIDSLSGLFNKGYISIYLDSIMPNLSDDTKVMGVMLDVNKFKSINDIHGHTWGDKAIEAVGEILRDSTRDNGICFRYGGDEFIVILKVKDVNEVQQLFDRVELITDDYNKKDILPFDLKLSMGYANYDIKECDDIIDFIDKMDEAMYKDKQTPKK